MNREAESQLIDFCVRQHRRPNVAQWLSFTHVEKDELAATAHFLAGTDWYCDDWKPLTQIAEQLRPGATAESLYVTTRFDHSRCSNLLRRELTSHASPAS